MDLCNPTAWLPGPHAFLGWKNGRECDGIVLYPQSTLSPMNRVLSASIVCLVQSPLCLFDSYVLSMCFTHD